jgi:arabinofuranan 3-O-arabinosyltransferase
MQLSTTLIRGNESIETKPIETLSERAPERRATRWWLAGAFVLALAAFVPDAFGRQVFDTKIDLTVNPFSFLHNLLYLWAPNGWFGYLRNQFQGSAFPTVPFFIVGHLLAIPAWLVQRFWMATVVTVAFWGIVRLAEELRIGSLGPRLAAGAAFALLPTLTILVGSETALATPGVLTAWATIPLVRASRSGSPIRGAALSGVAVLFMGGTNAADTLYALVIPALFLLTRSPSPRKRSLFGWWGLCVGLATAWWAIPLLFLGKYGFNFLPYVEQSVTTTSTSSATSALSGSSVWTAYLNIGGLSWNQAALTITSVGIVIFGAALMAATGLYGIASREIRERRFLVVSLAVTAVVALAAYWGPVGGPFSRFLLPILDGPLAPLRSVYKIEPEIGLLLALGIAHSLYKVSHGTPRRVGRVAWRVGVGVVTIAVLASLATPYLLGRGTNNDSFASIPSYWSKVADFLARESPRNTALVLPASSHGEYVWGWTVDQPLEALARSPWANDQAVPFGGAGSSRMVDSIELALRTDTASPGLPALLRRSGIKYVVLQNDELWQLSDSPSPLQVHQVLEKSGLKRVTQFGPAVWTSVVDAPTLRLTKTGYQVPYPAVEIYEVPPSAGDKGPISPVATLAASSAALVSGGPEAIKQLLDQGVIGVNQAAVLAGDWSGQYHGPLFAVTDTLRREDTNFGLVNDNSSYTFTTTSPLPDLNGLPNQPASLAQLLPFQGIQHQTVAVLKGASSITSSSAGSAFFYLPEYNPTNVFDGQSSTGWIAGNPYSSIGEWIQINFDHPVNPRGTHIKFFVGSSHPTVTGISVSTNRGSVFTRVSPTSHSQLVNVPAGKARYLRVTFVSFKERGRQTVGAGIGSISIPGVRVQSLLKPPQESIGTTARNLAFSFQTTPSDYQDLLRSPPEPVMSRQFSLPRRMSLSITGQATPRPGAALDALIGPSSLNISASSTFGNLPDFRPQNLIDSDPNTAWIAKSPNASIHMRWAQAVNLSSLVLVDARNSFAAPPQEVLISSSAGSRLIHVGRSITSTLNFAPLETNSVTVSFPKVRTRKIANGFGQTVQAPVGLAGLSFPALASSQGQAPPNPAADFPVPCGYGPPIVIDGTQYETSLGPVGGGPSPTVGDLLAIKPMSLTICARGPYRAGSAEPSGSPLESVTLNAGSHELVTPLGGMPFDVSALTLKEVGTPSVGQPVVRHDRILNWGQVSREVAMTSGPATYLEVHQNFSPSWTATLDGKTLTPIRLDGWQQGYLVPAGRGGTVHMTFGPERTYLLGLAVGALGVILLLLIAFGVIGKRRGVGLESSPPWNQQWPFWLSIGLVAGVVFVIGGPLVLAVPVLVFIGRWRPTWLPWVAFVGMTAAGVVAALTPGNGALIGVGAFSTPAQVCALIALSAVLVPIAHWRSQAGGEPNPASEPGYPDRAFAGVAADTREPVANGSGDHADGGTS